MLLLASVGARAQIGGKLVGLDGRPIEGVEVHAVPESDRFPYSFLHWSGRPATVAIVDSSDAGSAASTRVGSDGSFRFERLRPGRYFIDSPCISSRFREDPDRLVTAPGEDLLITADRVPLTVEGADELLSSRRCYEVVEYGGRSIVNRGAFRGLRPGADGRAWLRPMDYVLVAGSNDVLNRFGVGRWTEERIHLDREQVTVREPVVWLSEPELGVLVLHPSGGPDSRLRVSLLSGLTGSLVKRASLLTPMGGEHNRIAVPEGEYIVEAAPDEPGEWPASPRESALFRGRARVTAGATVDLPAYTGVGGTLVVRRRSEGTSPYSPRTDGASLSLEYESAPGVAFALQPYDSRPGVRRPAFTHPHPAPIQPEITLLPPGGRETFHSVQPGRHLLVVRYVDEETRFTSVTIEEGEETVVWID